MTTGGMVLEEASPEARKQAGLAENTLTLRVKYLGQYDEHAAARNAGFRQEDVIVRLFRLLVLTLLFQLVDDLDDCRSLLGVATAHAEFLADLVAGLALIVDRWWNVFPNL